MRYFALFLLLAAACPAQTPPPPVSGDADQLPVRMLQLMESTAVVVPGLIRASEPLKQNAEQTLAQLQRTPASAAATWQFINQMKAYLALSDSFPRPAFFPAAAEQQYAELRASLQRMQQNFEAILQTLNLNEQKREEDPGGLKRYAEANTKLLPVGKLPRVVFLGDAATEAWRLNEYFTGKDFINRGIAGQTTLQMLARFQQDVVSLHPKVVVIQAGANDLGAGVSLKQIEDNLTTLGELAKAHGLKVVFASILPVNDYQKAADPRYEQTKTHPPEMILQLNRWLKDRCAPGECVYLDYFSSLADTSGMLISDMSDDGLTPNGKGYRVMSPLALAAVDRAVAGTEPADTPATKRRFRPLGN